MLQRKGDPEPTAGRGRPDAWRYGKRWLSSASIAIVLLFAFGGALYHFVYVEHRRAALTEHHLHLLRRAAADVEATLLKLDQNIRNATRRSRDFTELPRSLRQMADMRDLDRGGPAYCRRATGAVCHVLSVDATQPLLRTYVGPAGGATSRYGPWHGVESDLHRLFSGLLPIGDFDALLLVREDSLTVYDPSDLLRPPEERRGRLGPLTLRRYGGEGPSAFSGTTVYPDTLGGDFYTAFVQPVRIPFALAYAEAPRAGIAEGRTWRLVGLRRTAALAAETRVIPPIWLYTVVIVSVVALLLLPILKVYHAGLRERLSVADVAYAALALAVAGSLLTAAALELVAYDAYGEHRDRRLHGLADGIEARFGDEVGALNAQLRTLDGALARRMRLDTTDKLIEIAFPTSSRNSRLDSLVHGLVRGLDSKGCYSSRELGSSDSVAVRHEQDAQCDPRLQNLLAATAHDPAGQRALLGAYPFMHQAFWVSPDGEQLLKLGPHEVTARTSVRTRDYFQLARDHARWTRARTPEWYLESIRGKINGRISAALSRPMSRPGAADEIPTVAVVSARLFSLHGPVLPPGTAFAVADPSGRVLFHADETKVLRENLLSRIPEPALATAMATRVPDRMGVRYWNRQYQVHARPLPKTPWTLVVFDDLDTMRALYGQVLLMTLALTALYFVALIPLLLLGAWLWAWSRSGQPRPFRSLVLQFWPGVLSPQQRGAFLALNVAVMLAYAGVLWSGWGGALGALATSITATLGLLAFLWRSVDAVSRAPADEGLADEGPARRARLRPWGLVGALFLTGSVLPTLLFYRVAHDEAIALRAKQELVTVADAVMERSARLRADFGALLQEAGDDCAPQPPDALGVYARLFPEPRHAAWDLPLAGAFTVGCGLAADAEDAGGLARQQLAVPWHPLRWAVTRRAPFNLALAGDTLRSGTPRVWTSRGDTLQLSPRAEGAPAARPAPLVVSTRVPTLAHLRLLPWVAVTPLLALLLVGFAAVRERLRAQTRPPEAVPEPAEPDGTGAEVWLRLGPQSRLSPDERDVPVDARRLHLRTPAELVEEVRASLAEPPAAEEPAASHRIIVENLFEGMNEGDLLNQKLDLIERLHELAYACAPGPERRARCRLILCSDVDPIERIFGLRSDREERGDGAAAGALNVERWAAALRPFAVRRDDAPDRFRRFADRLEALLQERLAASGAQPLAQNAPSTAGLVIARTILHECWMDYRLRAIGERLLAEYPADRLRAPAGDAPRRAAIAEAVVAALYRRAERHYRSFWALSSTDEKVVLYRLATDGIVSRRAGRTLDALQRRDLVHRVPYPTVMNESFRRFVTRAEPGKTFEQWEREEAESAWNRLTPPVLLSFSLVLVFLLLTQPSLVDRSLGLMAALGAAIPALARLIPFLFGTSFLNRN